MQRGDAKCGTRRNGIEMKSSAARRRPAMSLSRYSIEFGFASIIIARLSPPANSIDLRCFRQAKWSFFFLSRVALFALHQTWNCFSNKETASHFAFQLLSARLRQPKKANNRLAVDEFLIWTPKGALSISAVFFLLIDIDRHFWTVCARNRIQSVGHDTRVHGCRFWLNDSRHSSGFYRFDASSVRCAGSLRARNFFPDYLCKNMSFARWKSPLLVR